MTVSPIGGYFAWSTAPAGSVHPEAPSVAFRSARSALAACLRQMRVRRLWVPHHVCGAVMTAVEAAGVVARRYRLDGTWGVPSEVALDDDEWLLCVDYLGLSGHAVDTALRRFPQSRVIVDASQAFYRQRVGAETLLFSPRKFFPVPDGGWTDPAAIVTVPTESDDEASTVRAGYLHARAAGRLEAGYAAYHAAEASLAAAAPVALSGLTRALLAEQDLTAAREARRGNYATLRQHLEGLGFQVPALPEAAVPLFVPASVPDAAPIRATLAAVGIFSPTFWPDALPPADDTIGRALRNDTLYLPCDQRYGYADMKRVADALEYVMQQHTRHLQD
jgi:hypothetical protein